MHEAAVEAEMNHRVSMFHQQYEEKKAVRNDVLYNAFAALYWLAKEAVANVKFFSLLNLFRAVGLDKMQHFNHKSPAAVSLGNVKQSLSTIIVDMWCALKLTLFNLRKFFSLSLRFFPRGNSCSLSFSILIEQIDSNELLNKL